MMTKSLKITGALLLMVAVATAYNPFGIKLGNTDFAKNIETCAKKDSDGNCECPGEWCAMSIPDKQKEWHYGRKGVEGVESGAIELTGKNRKTCSEMVGKAAGKDKCPILFAAYLSKKQYDEEQGAECHVFCGFYPDMDNGVTLQMRYPGVQGSVQGAWGFIEAGVTCDDAVPDSSYYPRPETSYWSCAKPLYRNNMEWGGDPEQCCHVLCRVKVCPEGSVNKVEIQTMQRGEVVLVSREEDCCEPCAPTCPTTTTTTTPPRAPYYEWKTSSKCTNQSTSSEYNGMTAYDCQHKANSAAHNFASWKKTGGVCYITTTCEQYESGTATDWSIYIHEEHGLFPRPACKAPNVTEECNLQWNGPDCCSDYMTCDMVHLPGDPRCSQDTCDGTATCKSCSSGVIGNTCDSRYAEGVETKDPESGKFMHGMQGFPKISPVNPCCPGQICSSLGSNQQIGKCESCYAKSTDPDNYGKNWANGCSNFDGSGDKKKRCLAMHKWCPMHGKCYIGQYNKCHPFPKNCLEAGDEFGCRVCKIGMVVKYAEESPYSRACTAGDQAAGKCEQCSVICETGYSYAAQLGENKPAGSTADIPENKVFNCPEGYYPLPLPLSNSYMPAYGGCCAKDTTTTSTTSTTSTITTTTTTSTTVTHYGPSLEVKGDMTLNVNDASAFIASDLAKAGVKLGLAEYYYINANYITAVFSKVPARRLAEDDADEAPRHLSATERVKVDYTIQIPEHESALVKDSVQLKAQMLSSTAGAMALDSKVRNNVVASGAGALAEGLTIDSVSVPKAKSSDSTVNAATTRSFAMVTVFALSTLHQASGAA